VPQLTDRPSGCPIEIVAHRGASIEAPENTLAAVELAWQLGADAVEIDVQLTRDGQLAVIHDATLERTAGIDRRVRDVDMSELRKIDVGSWKGDAWRNETVSDLSLILASIPTGHRLFVELKGGDDTANHEEILAALKRDLSVLSSTPESVVLISFYPALLRLVKQSLPEFDAFLVVQQKPDTSPSGSKESTADTWSPTIDEIINVAVSSGFDGVDLSNTAAISNNAVEAIHLANLASCVWTVNSVDYARRLASVGVGSLTTDDPRTMLAALKN
jgi:glycerophosphoryl diester phosphodiesterase